MKPDGGPAFPITDAGGKVSAQGMCLRDYLAARLLDRIIAKHGSWEGEEGRNNRIDQAKLAYLYADAMLKAREM